MVVHVFLFTTFVALVTDLAEVNEVGPYGNVVDLIRVTYLDLHAFAKWREHFGEDDLLVPDGLVAALLDCSLSLQRGKQHGWTLCGGIVYLVCLF